MLRIASALALGCLVTLLSVAPAMAQNETSPQSLAEARDRISDLQKQVAILKARVMVLEEQVKRFKADKPTDKPDEKATSTSNSTPGTPTTASSKTPDRPQQPAHRFVNLLQPLALLPPKLRPINGQGWDQIHQDQAKAWFKETYTGDDSFTALLTIHVTLISPPVNRTVNGVKQLAYPVMLRFEAPSFTYIGIPFHPQPFRITIYTTADKAKQYQKLNPKIPLRVTGKLDSYWASMQYLSKSSGVVNWSLKDWKIHSTLLDD